MWFNSNIVLVIKILSKMLVWYMKGSGGHGGAFADYECDFEGGMSGAKYGRRGLRQLD